MIKRDFVDGDTRVIESKFSRFLKSLVFKIAQKTHEQFVKEHGVIQYFL